MSHTHFISGLLQNIKEYFRQSESAAKELAVEKIEHELEETELVFALLTIGFFVGIPTPPMHISLELLPYMEKELQLMVDKTNTAAHPLSDLFSVFSIE